MATVKNDWIVAGINHPDFTNEDFSNIAGMSVDNTQFLSKEEYMKSDFIKNNDAFKDENGKFSEEKFTRFYNQQAGQFKEFYTNDFQKGPALDIFNTDRTADSPVKNPHLDIRRGVNPDRQAIGVEGINVYSDPEFSKREIAKQNKVFDYTTGKYLDYSPDDHTLVTSPVQWVKDLFRDPLVMATYDEDGEHRDPITGDIKQHKKGDYKLNDYGTYYYETLGNRSVINKDVLSLFDTFTVDGQGLNKYDFFDSNDIEKSVGGTIVKNVASILPMFLGPEVGAVYSALMVGREMAKAMPMLYGMATALSDTDTPKWLNDLASFGSRLSSSTSDYAQQKTFAFENFATMVSDVALQWGQQKAIAQVFGKFKGTPSVIQDAQDKARELYAAKRVTLGDSRALWEQCLNKYMPEAQKLAERSSQLGRDMSLVYMAIISNTDVYKDALDHGTSKTEAAALALGSTIGMFGVDKYLHLGEIFFNEATPNTIKAARKVIRDEINKAGESFKAIRNSDAPKEVKIARWIKGAADSAKRVFDKFSSDLKYHSLTASEKMVGEGLEEVTEELVTDTAKSIYELAGELGFNTSVKDVGAWDNAFDRYVMNFLGGFVGGGIFYGKEVWDGGTFHRPKLDQDIATLIRNGHANDLRSQLSAFVKSGKVGSTTLSATDFTVDENGNKVWETTPDKDKSQASVIAGLINNRITSIEEAIIGNNANLNDDQLFDNMVLSEMRYQRYKGIASITNYYQDFADVLNKVVEEQGHYDIASRTIDGTVAGKVIPNDTALGKLTPEESAKRAASLDVLKGNLDAAKDRLKNFLSAENSLDYMRKLNFAMDPALHESFLELNWSTYLQNKYGKSWDQLTPKEQEQFKLVDWPAYVQEQLKTRLTDAYDKFKKIEKTVNPHLDQLGKDAPAYKAWLENFSKILRNNELALDDLAKSYKKWDDQLDGEPDDEYKIRNTKIISATGEEETDNEFLDRRRQRRSVIDAYNDAQDKAWIDKIESELAKVNYQVDPLTARQLITSLPTRGRLSNLIKRKIDIGTEGLASRAELFNSFGTNLLTIGENDRQAAILNLLVAQSEYTGIARGFFNLKLSDIAEQVKGEDKDKRLVDLIANANLQDDEPSIKNIAEDNPDDPDYDNIVEDIVDNAKLDDTVDKDALVAAIRKKAQKALENDHKGIISEATASIVSDTVEWNKYLSEKYKEDAERINDNAGRIVLSIKNSPLYKFREHIKDSIVNPIGELIKKVAASNNDQVSDIDEVLKVLTDDYESINDINDIQLDDVQQANMEKARNFMTLVKAYIAAASTTPNASYPMGHNKVINTFAQSHADKLNGTWNPLPEIDSSYAMSFITAFDGYSQAIDGWIELSRNNSVNKTKKIVRTDAVLNKTLWDVLATAPRSFTVKQEEGAQSYDLLDGIDSINTQENSKLAAVNTARLEQIFYTNVNKMLTAEGLTLKGLAENTDFFQSMLSRISELSQQRSSSIDDAVSYDKFTDFDKLQYLAAILTEDPSAYYDNLRKRVSARGNIAPIPAQELVSRIARAGLRQPFRDIMNATFMRVNKKTAIEVPQTTNTTIISGVAGAGKTTVPVADVDAEIKDKTVFIAGPTESQAVNLQNALGRDSSMTIDKLMETIIGSDQWRDISTDVQQLKSNGDGKYFGLAPGDDGFVKVRLYKDNIKFNTLPNAPAAIYIDEATHMNTVAALILDAYCKEVGAQLYLIGDSAQSGFVNVNNGIANIEPGALFASRAPELALSLRDANLQKAQNQNAVRMVLEEVLDRYKYADTETYMAFFPALRNLMKKFNFRIYNGNTINGDMITRTLDDGTLSKLKAAVDKGKSIAFIGSKSSSFLAQIQSAGINIPNENILSPNTVQGREFDYVVIDQDFNIPPTDMRSARPMLQGLYTLMTRAREASIFIDNGLSDIIGTNTIADYTAEAPSIKKGIEELRTNKLALLDMIAKSSKPDSSTAGTTVVPNGGNSNVAASPASQATTTQNQGDTTEQAPATDTADTVSAMLADPDHNDENDKKFENHASEDTISKTLSKWNTEDKTVNVDSVAIEHKNGIGTDGSSEADQLDSFPILAYQEFMLLDVDQENENGTIKSWTVRKPAEGQPFLRNLQVLHPGEQANDYPARVQWQRELADIKSWLERTRRCQVDYKQLPKALISKIDETHWKNGRFVVEFRYGTADDVRPLFFKLGDKLGITSHGKQLYATLVFKVENNNGVECRFDVAGLNDPKTLRSNIENIKNNIQGRLEKVDSTSDEYKRLQFASDNLEKVVVPKYEDWFKSKADALDQKYNEAGENDKPFVSIEQELNTNVGTTGTIWLRERDYKSRVRLDGNFNPNELETNNKKFNRRSFVSENYDKSISPVYIVINEGEGGNTATRGKSVVFVGPPDVDPNMLASEYIHHKLNPKEQTADIRMVMLDSYGCTFTQLFDRNFSDVFKPAEGKGGYSIIRNNFLGLRMFTSLWNARAALLNLEDAINSFKYNNIEITADMLDAAALLAHNASINEEENKLSANLVEAARQTLKNNNLSGTDEGAKKIINAFNSSDAVKKIPMFRIGYNTSENDFHIQQFDNLDGLTYKGGKANLCVLSTSRAAWFRDALDVLIHPIYDRDSKFYTSGLFIEESGKPVDANDSILSGDNYKKNYINLNEAKHSGTLSGLIHNDTFSEGTLYLNDQERDPIAYIHGDKWSIVPKIITTFVRSTYYAQINGNTSPSNTTTISFKRKNDNDAIMMELSTGAFFDENHHKCVLKSPSSDSDQPDPSLLQMLELIFNGTTQDIHARNKPIQLTDAYFKNGFYIDPDRVHVLGAGDKVEVKNNKMVLIKASTNPALFSVAVSANSPSFTLSLADLYGLRSKVAGTTQSTVSATAAPAIDTAKQAFNSKLSDILGPSFNPDEDDPNRDFTVEAIKAITGSFENKSKNVDFILDQPIYINKDNDGFITLREVVDKKGWTAVFDNNNNLTGFISNRGVPISINNTKKLASAISNLTSEDSNASSSNIVTSEVQPIESAESTVVKESKGYEELVNDANKVLTESFSDEAILNSIPEEINEETWTNMIESLVSLSEDDFDKFRKYDDIELNDDELTKNLQTLKDTILKIENEIEERIKNKKDVSSTESAFVKLYNDLFMNCG